MIQSKTQKVIKVLYFSAYAEHLKGTEKEGSLHRHKIYVAALSAKGVAFIPGNFARRKWDYHGGTRYRATWKRYEEKQTDVAIGLHVLRDAFQDAFDVALIVSSDTDMLPVFKMMRAEFPDKQVITVSSPERQHHQALIKEASDHKRIRRSQIEKALFGARVMKDGVCVARRPAAYHPPRSQISS